MRFSYTAEKSGGEIYRGTAEAKDRFELYSLVRREGGHIVSLAEDDSTNVWRIGYWNTKFSTVKEYDKVLLVRNLGAMLSAGLSLARALSVLERQTTSLKLKAAVRDVASDVRRGDTLHQSLTKFPNLFSPLMIAMVRAGEEGGDLPASLATIADQMERIYVLKKKIRGAMIYPAIIVFAIFIIGYLMLTQVVPTLAQTFAEMGAQLPATTQGIIDASNFLVTNTYVAAVILVGFVAAIIGVMRLPAVKRGFDLVLIHMPVIGEMVKQVNAARTSRTLASLFSSGVDVLTALQITGEVVQNAWFRDVISEAQQAVSGGEPLSLSFTRHDKLYPPFVGEMMEVGEETGQLGEMLKRLAVYYEDEVDRGTKDLSTIIEPFLMLFIGGGVGFFAVAMISPIYSLSQNI
jgi:type IV pilus assembly protein PilC